MPILDTIRRLTRRFALLASGLLSVVLTSCAWHGPRDTSHLFGEGIEIVGHRGARDLAPENTMASFEVPASMGYGFELDVAMSADGRLVVIHDDDLDRTTDGNGWVSETPWADIAKLDAGSHFGTAFAGEPVPELAQVLAHYGNHVVINIEVKSPRDKSTRPQLAQGVVAAIEAAGLVERSYVTSFDPFLLEQVRLANPDIRRGQIFGTFKDTDLSGIEKYVLKHLLLNKKAQPDLLSVEDAFLTRRYVRRMSRKGYRILTWTVDEADEMKRLAEMGVHGIITDRPDVATEALEAWTR